MPRKALAAVIVERGCGPVLLESLDEGSQLRVVLSDRNVSALIVKLDDLASQQTIFKEAVAGPYRTLWVRAVEDGHVRRGESPGEGEAAPWVEVESAETGRAMALLRPPSLLVVISRSCLEWLDGHPGAPIEISAAAPRLTLVAEPAAAHYPEGIFPGVMAESTEHGMLRRDDR
jgi:hypothetical protein